LSHDSLAAPHNLLREAKFGSTGRDWERLFIGEVKAGGDPSRVPTRSTQVNMQIATVSASLDAYLERCVKPAGLRSVSSVRSQIAVLKKCQIGTPVQPEGTTGGHPEEP
jgi:hypothetical protein